VKSGELLGDEPANIKLEHGSTAVLLALALALAN